MAKRRVAARALRDADTLRGTVRIGLLFSVTVLLPAVVLTILALSSLRSEEVSVEADLARRAEAVAGQVYRDLADSQERFERVAIQRLASGISVTENLGELSPHLRAAFRIDSGGRLVAPFATDPGEPVAPRSPAYEDLRRDAARAEREARYEDAALTYALAAARAASRADAGEMAFARARVLRKSGDLRAAEAALGEVYADFTNVRDARGVRMGDLVALTVADIATERHEPQLGQSARRDLVDRLLDETWTIGRPAESAVARLALDRLAEAGEGGTWMANARARLNERQEQLYWAGQLLEELSLLADVSRPGQDVFVYYPRPESRSLWATIWWANELYAFVFEYDAVVRGVRDASNGLSAADPDLQAIIMGPEGVPSRLATRTLAPWLPTLAVAIVPFDQDLLAKRKRQARQLRLVVVLVAIGITVFGVVFMSRVVAQELEGATMKADFAANVSHELRSPITQIRLKGEALQFDLCYDDADRHAHYDAIVREAERLSRLVDNVLDFAAIERGAKRYTFRPEDLADVVRASAAAAAEMLAERGMTLEIDVPDGLPVVWLDREAIGQVLQNLLSNAAKYGADGHWVGVRAREGLDSVDLLVADRGRGINKEELSRIFERFFRSSDPEVRSRRGTGIGLTIVRYIVDAHRGTISVDSAPGKGTTFTITFPMEPPPEANEA
jgi:signal transduction histidine kinase